MYIKMLLTDAELFNMIVTDEIASLPSLKLEVGVDIRNYLIYHDIGDFTYIRIGLFDLVNHNRIYKTSEYEENMWNNIINENGWEIVESIPFVDIIGV